MNILLQKLIELPEVFTGGKKYDFIINFHIFCTYFQMHKAFSPIYQSVRQIEHYNIHQYKAGTIFFLMRPDLSESVDKCISCGTLITPTPIMKEMTKM